jgi:sugar lactone lactonase YvrE
MRAYLGFLCVGVCAAAAGCGGGDDKIIIGGTVTGLSGTGLVLTNNGGDDLTVTADGHFEFETKLAAGKMYDIAVKADPTTPWQMCAVTAGGSGTAGKKDVTDIEVACSTDAFTVGGSVTGLAGVNLVVQNSGGDVQTITADGAFVFPAKVLSGATYTVAVKDQPLTPTQTCTVANGTGTVAGADITDVAISCATNKYTIGGTVTGASGPGLVLQNNLGDDLALPADGPFMFATSIDSGAMYSVTAKGFPVGQACRIEKASGTVVSSNVTDVKVTCAANVWSPALFPITIPNDTYGLGDLAFDGNGDLLATVAAPGHSVVRISRIDGSQTTIASGIAGTYLLGIAYRAANDMIYVHNDSGQIYSVTQNGTVTLVATVASLNAITIAPNGFGNFGGYIIGVTNGGRVVAVDPTNGTTTDVAPAAGSASDLAFAPDGTLYITGVNSVRTVAADGTFATFKTGFSAAEGITISPDGSKMFLADSGTDMVYQVTIPGGVQTTIGAYDIDDGFFVAGILADMSNTVIVMTGETAMTLQAFTY